MTIKNLRTTSIAYLLLPNFIFYWGWTATGIAIIGTGLLLFFLYDDFKDKSFGSERVFSHKDLLILIGTALFLAIVSGLNGYTYQTKDHWAHNAKFLELFAYPWPVRLPDADSAVISYYYGFYAIPSLINRMAGSIVESFILLWTSLGLALGIGWIYLSVNKRLVFLWLILCLGDLPRVVIAILALFSNRLYTLDQFGIENWSVFENLFWVPNQVIPALILGGMFMYILLNHKDINLMVLPIAMSFWWAVFPAFVSGLLVAILIIRTWIIAQFKLEWDNVVRKTILPFIACVPVLILFLSHEIIPVSGFLWEFDLNLNNIVRKYTANILLNILLFTGSFVAFNNLKSTERKLPFYISIFLCLVFPLYRMGEVNDLLIRGMMPVLVIIGIYIFHPLSAMNGYTRTLGFKNSVLSWVLIFLLFSSSFLGISRLWRAIRLNRINDSAFKAMPYDAYPNVYEALKVEWSQEGADQYTGDRNSYYEKYIAPQRKP